MTDDALDAAQPAPDDEPFTPDELAELTAAGIDPATARKIAVLFYNALRHGMAYADPGASYYEERYKRRVLAGLQRRAKALGYVLQPTSPEPATEGVS